MGSLLRASGAMEGSALAEPEGTRACPDAHVNGERDVTDEARAAQPNGPTTPSTLVAPYGDRMAVVLTSNAIRALRDLDRAAIWERANCEPIPEGEAETIAARYVSTCVDSGDDAPAQRWYGLVRFAWETYGVIPAGFNRFVRPGSRRPPRWLLDLYGLAPLPRRLPIIADAFTEGWGPMPSSPPMQGLLAAFNHAPHWERMPDGRPFYAHTPQRGQWTVATSIQPAEHADMDDRGLLPALVLRELETYLRGLSDLDGDVLIVCLAQALHRPGPDGTTWVTADHILDCRGVAKKTARTGNAKRTAGHRNEDRADIAACMERLDRIWIDAQGLTLFESTGRRATRRPHAIRQAKLLVVEERVVLRAGGADLPLAWRFRPGAWLAPFIQAPNRQVARVPRPMLRYDPYREQLEKRLARYLAIHFRIDAKTTEPLRRVVGTLLNELDIAVDGRHPLRTRRRFERALDHLHADGVIAAWAYDIDTPTEGRHWLATWLRSCISVTPPTVVAEHYEDLATTRAARKGRRRP